MSLRRPAAGATELAELATQTGVVDLIIPRGGEGLKAALKGVATVPVIYAASGNNHVYVDAERRPRRWPRRSCSTPSCSGPGACNAAEKLLVHARRGRRGSCPASLGALRDAGVRAARRRSARRSRRRRGSRSTRPPSEDWDTEYLALEMAVAVVDSVEEAIEHINAPRQRPLRGDRHRATRASARAFQLGVDAACVYVNASTRFTDGGEFGMGAEIGNSTQKLHARGPIGLRELCTFKYLVEGDGHVRA